MSARHRAILGALARGETLNLAECWVELVELVGSGHVAAHRASNGQLAIDGLTALGKMEVQAKPVRAEKGARAK